MGKAFRPLKACFHAFALGDIPGNGGSAGDPPLGVPDGRKAQRNVDGLAAFMHPDGVIGRYALSALNPLDVFQQFVLFVRGNEQSGIAADDFRRRIPVKLFSPGIPRFDVTVAVEEDNGIVRRVNDRSEPENVLSILRIFLAFGGLPFGESFQFQCLNLWLDGCRVSCK
ncbi:MAG: hypothetical protein RBR20_07640 [Desulfobacterales bacterium]|nr:hypothetical protein [Desulfobacteraceae bacterium]MDY0311984.1 hypothetical protein [Desulfobacterales bacterium]